MRPRDVYRVEAVVVTVLSDALMRVELANGHRLLAFKTLRQPPLTGWQPGEKVAVEVSPFDLSKGRLLMEQ